MSGNEAGRTIILNSLIDMVMDGELLDSESTAILTEIYSETTDADERAAFERTVHDLTTTQHGEQIDDAAYQRHIASVVEAVLVRLTAASVTARVCHDVTLSVSSREAALYTYATTRDTDALAGLPLSAATRTVVLDGASYVSENRLDRAVSVFERAVAKEPAYSEGDGSTYALLALARHWNGSDEAALDAVKQALLLDRNAWTARMIGIAADHDFPDLFRQGTFGTRLYIRATVEGTGRTVAASREAGIETEWNTLYGGNECYPVEHLWPETGFRLELSGAVDDFPTLLGYHLSWGVINLNDVVARTAEGVFLTGPGGAVATESIRLNYS